MSSQTHCTGTYWESIHETLREMFVSAFCVSFVFCQYTKLELILFRFLFIAAVFWFLFLCLRCFLVCKLSNLNHLHLLCMFIPYMKNFVELKQYELGTCYNLHVMSKNKKAKNCWNRKQKQQQLLNLTSCETLTRKTVPRNSQCNNPKTFAIVINDKVQTLTCIISTDFWWILLLKRLSPEIDKFWC